MFIKFVHNVTLNMNPVQPKRATLFEKTIFPFPFTLNGI